MLTGEETRVIQILSQSRDGRLIISRGIKFTLKPQPFTLVEKESYLARYFLQSAVWKSLKAWRGNIDIFLRKGTFPKVLPQILLGLIWAIQSWGLVIPGDELELLVCAAWTSSLGKLCFGVAFPASSKSW